MPSKPKAPVSTNEEIKNPVIGTVDTKSVNNSSSKEAQPVTMTAQQVAQMREDMKKELKQEIQREVVKDMNALEVNFEPTVVEGSDKIADKLNQEEKVLVTWDLEGGVPLGFMEEVKINGAVARIPRGVGLYAPISVKKMITKYQTAEAEVGKDIPNQAGGTGVRADRDPITKSRLGL